jgi:hypothetical protein
MWFAISIAVALGIVCDLVCVVLAGAGHGTYLPLCIFFGPLAVIPNMYLPAFSLGPILYGGYAAIVANARSKGRAARTLALIGLAHYGCTVLAYFGTNEDIAHIFAVARILPFFCGIAVLLVVVVNATAIVSVVCFSAMEAGGRTE